jgi:hypothetical protein
MDGKFFGGLKELHQAIEENTLIQRFRTMNVNFFGPTPSKI